MDNIYWKNFIDTENEVKVLQLLEKVLKLNYINMKKLKNIILFMERENYIKMVRLKQLNRRKKLSLTVT